MTELDEEGPVAAPSEICEEDALGLAEEAAREVSDAREAEE